MSNSLEERLRANSSAFDGLLALIPAKYYYDEKSQEQWKAKKKTKEQSKNDKLKKLDPEQRDDETSSTLEVMKKKEKDAKPVVLPGEKFKHMKMQKQKEATSKVEGDSDLNVEANDPMIIAPDEDEEEEEDIKVIFDDEGNEIPLESKKDITEPDRCVEKKSITEEEKLQRKKNLEALRSKLQAKISDMKSKRKAPGSREAILAQRKRKEELKKRKRLESEQDQDQDEIASDSDMEDIDSDLENNSKKRFKKGKKDSEINADGVMFQNIIFDDGARATSDLQRLRKAGRTKGPAKNDVKSHLKLLEAKKNKMEAKDELEQIKQKEKEKWQKAMLQAEGIKIRDDEKLLRKAIKRKEAQKRKSAIEWSERKRVVEDTISERQKRREENLRIRKDNKGKKRNKQEKMKRKYVGSAVPKKRAGFEGRLKTGKKKGGPK
ncbi:BAH_G0031960.mRNA.1.CDS.1 [Saccharomyces cerevisiae]|nr:SX2_G0004010.mRNA.1.CDS.1 [Saccharomyces cerevisiae]CAI4561820.1 BAH_G0031960.mRNA.1.CDS.1 [Saccharomyces cerevisiae]CAI4566182.1 BAG_1a_G0032050.mRNA.1.CDS.1 [Saccharomyces cerevisiae]CAI7180159.1 BAG_1a_G0032050.mRNA.1.CDS.1 [Saccharomyces cerevisiae]CAI7181467.1 BAH_G0031960.mRNA.1.CDS.1 [Saccharomyces cerevisiae]